MTRSKMTWPRLRVHEWMFLFYFAYVAAIAPLFPTRPTLHGQPVLTLVAVSLTFCFIAWLEQGKLAKGMRLARDWMPIFFLLIAFREMDYFSPQQYDFMTEVSWVRWDWILLDGYRLREKIEAFGQIIPFYLEFCYLIVYGVSAYCVGRLSALAGRKAINRFWNIYLLGTLGAYMFFPYFPTEPPRHAFPDISPPTVMTFMRQVNLSLLRNTTIHSGVFPSAHVSSVFSSAFAMFLLMPRGQRDGWFLLLYAISVTVATLYGRYHYAVDALAGFGLSLLAAALCLLYYAYDVKHQ